MSRLLSRMRTGGWLTSTGKLLGAALLIALEPIVFANFAAHAAPGVAETFGAGNSAASTTLSATPGSPTGSGDLLIGVVKIRDTSSLATVSGVTDSAINSWTRAAGVTQGSQSDAEVWYTANAGSVSSVTVTATAASAMAITVLDVTGAVASPLDVIATASSTGTSASAGPTATTSQANEISVGAVGWNGAPTPSGETAGYTLTSVQRSTASGAATGEEAAYQILSATGTQTYGATLSASGSWTALVATFKLGNPAPLPTITSLSVTSGKDGDPVNIVGTHFTGATAVAFNGTADATFSVTDDSDISAHVPSGATSGFVTVTTPGGTASSSPTSFTVKPAITGFTPGDAPIGTLVTITGGGFTGATLVSFNGTTQAPATVTDAQITVTVPCTTGTGTNPITVTTPGGTSAPSSASFTVDPTPAPSITSLAPTSGPIGKQVVLTGTGFGCASSVAFPGASQTELTVSGDTTQITTTVPSGATGTSTLTVTAPAGTSAASSQSFTVTTVPLPTIASFIPNNGSVGSQVVITGTNFTGATAVGFNGTSQTVLTVNSPTKITTTVPAGATTGSLTVTTSGGTSSPSTSTFNVHLPHIMLIVMENKAYSSAQGSPFVIGNSQAPYINNTLVKKYTSATHWFAVEHGSPHDYYDLISGSDQSSVTKPYTATTVADELNSAHIPWKAYMESMPSACYNGLPVGPYHPDHNPFDAFSDYKSLCSGGNGVVPYAGPFSTSQLKTDLNSAIPPDFIFFTPNICDDMHTNGTPCGPSGVTNGDTWLSTFIPGVQATTWYANGGIIIITWDESINADTSGGTFGNGGQIPLLVISGHPHGAFAPSGDHFAVLRAIEETYGVGLLGNSANASFGDLKPAF